MDDEEEAAARHRGARSCRDGPAARGLSAEMISDAAPVMIPARPMKDREWGFQKGQDENPLADTASDGGPGLRHLPLGVAQRTSDLR